MLDIPEETVKSRLDRGVYRVTLETHLGNHWATLQL